MNFPDIQRITIDPEVSVIQIRTVDVRPAIAGDIAVAGIKRAEEELIKGALVTIHFHKMRISALPLNQRTL